jgi:hypothetical protein
VAPLLLVRAVVVADPAFLVLIAASVVEEARESVVGISPLPQAVNIMLDIIAAIKPDFKVPAVVLLRLTVVVAVNLNGGDSEAE